MRRSLKSLRSCWKKLRSLAGTSRGSRPAWSKRLRPEFEALEDRQVPTILFRPHFGTETLGSSDPGKFSMTSAMQDPQLFLIFWGNYWATSQGRLDQTTLTNEVQTILGSPFLGAGSKDGMVQYGSDGQATLAGTYADTTTHVGPGTQEVVSMSDVNTFINNTIIARHVPDPSHFSHDPIYAVITEPGAGLDIGGGGYNQPGTYTDGTSIHMIWVGTANPSGSVLADSFTGVFSHELV